MKIERGLTFTARRWVKIRVQEERILVVIDNPKVHDLLHESQWGDQGSPLFSVSLNILSRFPHILMEQLYQGYGRIILANGANTAKTTQQGHWALFLVLLVLI